MSRRIPLLILLAATAGYGQSLADVARQNRAQRDQNAATKKIITTDDLSPAADPDAEVRAQFKIQPNQPADMWTRQILTQKVWVRYFQGENDKLTDSLAKARNIGVQSNRPVTKQEEDDLAQRLERVRRGLAQETKKLDALQQAARQAGMPNSVVDPPIPHRVSTSNAGALRYMHSLGQH